MTQYPFSEATLNSHPPGMGPTTPGQRAGVSSPTASGGKSPERNGSPDVGASGEPPPVRFLPPLSARYQVPTCTAPAQPLARTNVLRVGRGGAAEAPCDCGRRASQGHRRPRAKYDKYYGKDMPAWSTSIFAACENPRMALCAMTGLGVCVLHGQVQDSLYSSGACVIRGRGRTRPEKDAGLTSVGSRGQVAACRA